MHPLPLRLASRPPGRPWRKMASDGGCGNAACKLHGKWNQLSPYTPSAPDAGCQPPEWQERGVAFPYLMHHQGFLQSENYGSKRGE